MITGINDFNKVSIASSLDFRETSYQSILKKIDYLKLDNIEEFELNLLEIENYQKSSESRLRFWFNHIRDNALIDNGNIFEFGVYRGSSLIASALILKEMG